MTDPILPETELKVGDTVHWRACVDHPIEGYPCQVRKVERGMFGPTCLDGTPDTRIFYDLVGSGYRNPVRKRGQWNVITSCTGRSILESSLYIIPTPEVL
jgi:hypothetical protein